MQYFKWYKTYSVNHEEIDVHHKTLFGIFNRLLGILDGKGDVDAFKSAIDELGIYSNYHFKAEEHYMRETGYTDIDKQIAAHQYFADVAKELKHKTTITDYKLCHDIIVFLGSWLLKHVMEEDKKIALQT